MTKNWIDNYEQENDYHHALGIYDLAEFVSEYCKNEMSNLVLKFVPKEDGPNGYIAMNISETTGREIESFQALLVRVKNDSYHGFRAASKEELIESFNKLRVKNFQLRKITT